MILILASSSPRRRQLLANAGYRFVVQPPDQSAEQNPGGDLTPIELVAELALQKARDVASRTASGLVLAADTVAECCGQVLGKPRDRDQAREMLTLMSGQDHFVHTGVCLWLRPDDHRLVRTDTTHLHMNRLSTAQIEAFLDSQGWVGKAGGFGYQDGLDWVHITAGSESNVVGLPMELLADMLREIDAVGPPPRD